MFLTLAMKIDGKTTGRPKLLHKMSFYILGAVFRYFERTKYKVPAVLLDVVYHHSLITSFRMFSCFISLLVFFFGFRLNELKMNDILATFARCHSPGKVISEQHLRHIVTQQHLKFEESVLQTKSLKQLALTCKYSS